MGALRELLRPPAHRGPVIAGGAVALTTGLLLEQIRISPGDGWQLAVLALPAALLLWLGVQARLEGGRPPAYQSVLLVCGLLLLYGALLRFADLVDDDFGLEFPDGWLAVTGLVQASVAAWVAVRRNSAVAALIAAVAAAIALLSGWSWVFDTESVTPYRWLLLALAIAYAIGSLPLRGMSQRHAEQMINAAGLMILAIAVLEPLAGGLFGLLGAELPGFWELVLLAAGFGLIAYAAADRAPGPAYVGTLVLLAFVAYAGYFGDDLRWWPLALLALGVAGLAAGLRPRAPLPPEPSGYRRDELPLAARTGDDVTVRVRQD
ncbi:MAG TPA: hypothetical protein VM266_07765 [Solirubrobacteraceae bacterium]|nr:hypothetical protein [Solirubrobacteraceae bacterium]